MHDLSIHHIHIHTWALAASLTRHVRLAYKPCFFSQRILFFSHTKSANSTFSHGLLAKQAQTALVSWLAESSVLLFIVERGMPLVLCRQLFAIVL